MSRIIKFNVFMAKVASTVPLLFATLVATLGLMYLFPNPYFINMMYVLSGLIWGLALGRKFSTVIK